MNENGGPGKTGNTLPTMPNNNNTAATNKIIVSMYQK